MKILLTLLSLLLSVASFSQVKGKLIDSNGVPVAAANITVNRVADSSVVSSLVSNEQGLFESARLDVGNYYLRISCIGFITAFSNKFQQGVDSVLTELPTIVLQEEKEELGDVVVRAKKQLVEYTPTGKVFNIQSSLITKGSNALQALERLPGVVTDRRNNQFSLNGQNGVLIYFNGRQVPLSMAELMTLLESTAADNIEKIELITSPTAKHDADGSAGIINIVFKKKDGEGTKANIAATAGYGWRQKAVASMSLFHGFKKGNINGSYAYMNDASRSGFMGSGTSEKLFDYGQNTATFSGIARRFQNTHTLNVSGDVQANAKTTLGADLLLSFNGSHSLSNNDVSWDFDSGKFLQFRALSDGRTKSRNIVSSIYSRHKISNKAQLNIDAGYIHYANNSPAIIDANYFDRIGNPTIPPDSNFTTGNRGQSVSAIDAFTLSIDFSAQLSKQLQAEFGTKGSIAQNSNNSKIERMISNHWEADPRSQSLINSTEKIGAFYAQLRLQLNAKANLQAGLRYEYWQRDLNLYKTPFVIGKLFPSLLYTYTFDERNTLSFGYNRRLSRPSYSDLISNLFYNDPTFVFSGNPLLQPTLTDAIKAEYTRNRFNAGLSFVYESHPVLRYQITSNATKDIGISSPQNLDYQKSINLFLNYSFSTFNWWKFSINSTTSLRNYKVSYSLVPATKTFVFQKLNFNQTFLLPFNIEAELSGWYNLPFYEGTNFTKAFGIVNLAIAKKLKNDNGSFQLSLPDLFRSFSVHTHIGGMTAPVFNINTVSNWRDETAFHRVIKLTYSRSFGKTSVRKANTKTQSEEAERIR
jgi:iron complex outermembrane receptor protein